MGDGLGDHAQSPLPRHGTGHHHPERGRARRGGYPGARSGWVHRPPADRRGRPGRGPEPRPHVARRHPAPRELRLDGVLVDAGHRLGCPDRGAEPARRAGETRREPRRTRAVPDGAGRPRPRPARRVRDVAAGRVAARRTRRRLHPHLRRALRRGADRPGPLHPAGDADGGRLQRRPVINSLTARSQMIGGMCWGLGQALLESSEIDTNLGRFVSKNLAGYLLPVSADIHELDASFIEDEFDAYASALGAKGMGELGAVGAGPAIANAVYHATGVRVRELPIRPEMLLAATG
ncbi:xanthine dehydrogenase family protein molybdopterin-binding subunit [Rhodococcus opacus]|nr:xanthine dehydrogenase family protein molybdopterin-binding subunit [Rhodococcus opacus]